MKKLLLIFLFGTMAYAQPNINPPLDLTACQFNPGVGVFDLTFNNEVVLSGLNPNSFDVTYHETLAEANAGMNVISNPNIFLSATTIIYVRVTEIADSSNYVVAQFYLNVYAITDDFGLDSGFICIDLNSTETTTPYILDTGLNNEDYDFSWTYEGMPIGSNQSTLSATMAGTYEVTVAVSGVECIYTTSANVFLSGPASAIGSGYTLNGQDVTITVEGPGLYEFQLDEGEMQESNIFNNVSLGNHTVLVHDVYGCGTLTINFSTTLPPTGQPEQTFFDGQTLADLEIEGENIQWYDNDGEGMPDFPDGISQPLPLTTVLVDGTTYYASQTIDGIESSQRLAVTVYLIIGLEKKVFSTLKYYPNPANNLLNIENTTEI
ncbi:MAG: hypothetical protein DI539_18365, partial [Flavobacterium psychrophilum]